MSAYASIAELKSAAEFFPAGKIIPRRILKAPRRFSSGVRFGSDTWVLNTPKGYLCATDQNTGERCAIRIQWIKNAVIKASPYHQDGFTCWVGSTGWTDEQWLKVLNEYLAEHFSWETGSAP